MNMMLKASAVVPAVAIAGPTLASAAPPPTDAALVEAYLEWLVNEHSVLQEECWPGSADVKYSPVGTAARAFHFPSESDWKDRPQPSTRARLVLETVGAIGAKPDPVLAAIELHARLNEANNEVIRREPIPPTRGDDIENDAHTTALDAWKDEQEASCDAWNEARDAMWETVPTTRAGALALLNVIFADAPTVDERVLLAPEDAWPLLQSLAKAIPNLV